MSRDRFEELLKSLPRETASGGFTARVMARLPEHRSLSLGLRPTVLAVTIGVVAVVAVLMGVLIGVAERRHEAAERQAALTRVEELRREYEDLQAELEMLRRVSAESRPVIGVVGNEEYDYLLDLRELLPRESQGSPKSGARRVSFKP